jgi:valyl-tRNA synthetase
VNDRSLLGRDEILEPFLMRATWPVADERLIDGRVEREMDEIQEVIRGIRNIRGTAQIHHSLRLDVYIHTETEETAQDLMKHRPLLEDIGCCSLKEVGTSLEKPAQSAAEILPHLRVFVPLAGVIDIDKEVARHRKKVEKLQKRIEVAEKKLKNPNFVDRAPKEVVEREEEALAEVKSNRDEILQQIESLVGK